MQVRGGAAEFWSKASRHIMTFKHLSAKATTRERFVGVFVLLLIVFYVTCAGVFAFTDARSNIVWHGEELRGWRLFAANFC